MKVVPLRSEGQYPSAKIFLMALGQSPTKQLTVDEMRKRVRVMDRLEELPDDANEIQLEDLDVLTLKNALSEFPWAVANKELLRVIDDVEGAKAVSKPVSKPAPKEALAEPPVTEPPVTEVT